MRRVIRLRLASPRADAHACEQQAVGIAGQDRDPDRNRDTSAQASGRSSKGTERATGPQAEAERKATWQNS